MSLDLKFVQDYQEADLVRKYATFTYSADIFTIKGHMPLHAPFNDFPKYMKQREFLVHPTIGSIWHFLCSCLIAPNKLLDGNIMQHREVKLDELNYDLAVLEQYADTKFRKINRTSINIRRNQHAFKPNKRHNEFEESESLR